MTLAPYTGLGPFQTPSNVERVMRGVGRIFSGSKVLRICGSLGGDSSFEDGARIGGGQIEIYKPKNVQEWAIPRAIQLDPRLAQMPESYQKRAAACLSAVLGIDGSQPTGELIVWLDPRISGPEYWAILAAKEAQIPVHDLADPGVLVTWADWIRQHLPKPAENPAVAAAPA